MYLSVDKRIAIEQNIQALREAAKNIPDHGFWDVIDDLRDFLDNPEDSPRDAIEWLNYTDDLLGQ